ncbi:cation diffusion facilitator family transporter [Photobacterium damselae]
MSESVVLEKRYLLFSALCNLLVGVVGVIIALKSSSQAILLDALFNLSYFATGLFTIKVAYLVTIENDDRFPYGYGYFEPLVNAIKGILVLGVSLMALFGSIEAIIVGGRHIDAGFAVGYGFFASFVCWLATFVIKRGSAKTNSPLLIADSQNWLVNAAISSCVLLAFATIFIFKSIGLEYLNSYVDPVIVLLIVSISISVPIKMAYNSIMSLLNRAPNKEIEKEVTDIVDEKLIKIGIQERHVRILQPGRHRFISIYIIINDDKYPGLNVADELRDNIQDSLENIHKNTYCDIIFTSKRKWAITE